MQVIWNYNFAGYTGVLLSLFYYMMYSTCILFQCNLMRRLIFAVYFLSFKSAHKRWFMCFSCLFRCCLSLLDQFHSGMVNIYVKKSDDKIHPCITAGKLKFFNFITVDLKYKCRVFFEILKIDIF